MARNSTSPVVIADNAAWLASTGGLRVADVLAIHDAIHSSTASVTLSGFGQTLRVFVSDNGCRHIDPDEFRGISFDDIVHGMTGKERELWLKAISAFNAIHDNDAAKDTLNGLLKLGGARELAMASQPGAKQAPLEVD